MTLTKLDAKREQLISDMSVMMDDSISKGQQSTADGWNELSRLVNGETSEMTIPRARKWLYASLDAGAAAASDILVRVMEYFDESQKGQVVDGDVEQMTGTSSGSPIVSLKLCFRCGFTLDHQDDEGWDRHRDECPGKDAPALRPGDKLARDEICKDIIRYHVLNTAGMGNVWLRLLLSFKAVDYNETPSKMVGLLSKLNPLTLSEAYDVEKVVDKEIWEPIVQALEKSEWEKARGNWRYTGILNDQIKPFFPALEDWVKTERENHMKSRTLEVGEFEYRDLALKDRREVRRLVLPVKILQYPEGFDELIGRAYIQKDVHISMSALEAKLAGAKHTETLTNAKELTFVLSPSYNWDKLSPVTLSFYFRKENVMFKKSDKIDFEREVPEDRPAQKVKKVKQGQGKLGEAIKSIEEAQRRTLMKQIKEGFTQEQIAHAEKSGFHKTTPEDLKNAKWLLPVPSQTILDFRVVELKGDYWLFWHDDSHANDGMLPGYDESDFKAKVYLLLEIEHYADPVNQNYWSCGMRSPYKVPKEAIDRQFISLRYRWMTDPNEYNIMSGHWGEKTLTTDGAGTFEQLAEEVSEEYIQAQSIEQFNQIRGVPGTLTHAPSKPANEVDAFDEEEVFKAPAPYDAVDSAHKAQLLEEGPESWVVRSADDLPDWYWNLEEFDMNMGDQWGKIQIAPGHFVFYDGSGPRGRWSVPPIAKAKENGRQLSEDETRDKLMKNLGKRKLEQGSWPPTPVDELTLDDVMPVDGGAERTPENAFQAGKIVGAAEAGPMSINGKDAKQRMNEEILNELLEVKELVDNTYAADLANVEGDTGVGAFATPQSILKAESNVEKIKEFTNASKEKVTDAVALRVVDAVSTYSGVSGGIPSEPVIDLALEKAKKALMEAK